MNIRFFIIIALLICANFNVFSQERKNAVANRVTEAPVIDGILNDNAWVAAETNTDFYMLRPSNVGPARNSHPTTVKIIYDDEAVYFAASMLDPDGKNIASEISQRDEFYEKKTDFIGISLNPYNDDINFLSFIVTSAGTIADMKSVRDYDEGDSNFDAVFDAKVSKDDNGWYAEFKIPYSALRFPKKEIQTWGLNFYRRIFNLNEIYTWNYVDRSVGSYSEYLGTLNGIQNIDPPTRLFFYPYSQVNSELYKGNTGTGFSAGMDIKYGINEAFTLDATLIPDFGQVKFDDVELNLSPFEQQFDEKRAFFTEGTELFDRAGVFYSRRIGGDLNVDPEDYLQENESVLSSDNSIDLINAIKVSGRTDNKLGIGFFNAITKKTTAILQDSITQNQREVTLEPLTNYNIVVLDQQLKNNSSITFLNTSVKRNSNFRNAIVSTLNLDYRTKKNNYRIEGSILRSDIKENGNSIDGYKTTLKINKTMGNFRWMTGVWTTDENYNQDDMGISRWYNNQNIFANISYEIFNPTKYFNQFEFKLSVRHGRRYTPSIKRNNNYEAELFFETNKLFKNRLELELRTLNKDFFEPRVDGLFVLKPKEFSLRYDLDSDNTKDFVYGFILNTTKSIDEFYGEENNKIGFAAGLNYKISKRLNTSIGVGVSKEDDDLGYAGNEGSEVIIGIRDVKINQAVFDMVYNIDSYKEIALEFRNYWSSVNYKRYYNLQDNGIGNPIVNYPFNENPNANFNIWNLDLSYNWRFAPGSSAAILYRNQIYSNDDQSLISYTESLDNLFGKDIGHQFSIRINYFLDYNRLKKKRI
ncbi:MAG: DUF5916 domain-containing protein [Flavobacteriaceae bacterium]|nr:DUF5916 domain-containing protein [Flavobacteriaceae bacterium]